MDTLEKWTGQSKIVFAVDIGTMQSAVSFLYLRTGRTPQVEQVSSWPGQPHERERSKTLTAIYYDQSGKPRSFGAETQINETQQQAANEGWFFVHSFKRHVHRLGNALSTDISASESNVEALPENVSIESIYVDWLSYLFKHAQSIFISKSTKGAWDSLCPGLELVFTVPNGWYTQEHGFMARAALAAGIVEDNSNISFVPETEAAVHWALHQGALEPSTGMDFIVCDSGGSTTDIALYNVSCTSPLQLQEKQGFPSKCIEAGSALIDYGFDEMVGEMFGDKLGEDEMVELSTNVREGFTKEKHEFDASKETYVFPVQVEIGRDGFPNGELEVPCDDVAKHFDKEIAKIVTGIDELKGQDSVKYLLLLGDFGHSPYFQDQLRDKYEPGMVIVQAGHKNVKAVAAGALIWFLKHSVVARAARFAFGQQILTKFNPDDQEHVRRGPSQQIAGDFVNYGWDLVIPYGILLSDGQEHKRSYYRWYLAKDAQLSDFETSVYTAEETAANGKWICDSEGNLMQGFQKICTITADISSLQGKLPMATGPRGPYWYLNFDVVIAFGSTSLRARIVWKENGKTCSGPATLIPAEFV